MKIAIAASMAFAKEILEYKQQLEALGHTVHIPQVVKSYIDGSNTMQDVEEKKNLDVFRKYFAMLKEQDALLVLNLEKKGIPGYIGANTLIEIAFAHVLNLKIFLLNEIPQMDCTNEIAGMEPIVLGKDLSKIQ